MSHECFTQRGDYLALAVPGLSENRPSVMLGDSVLVSLPQNHWGDFEETDQVEYEGFVHEVHHSEVSHFFYSLCKYYCYDLKS